MPTVKAPYNFVPLNNHVFFPPWAKYISHDVPFKNGLSGSFELKITAESPIFVGGGEKEELDENSMECLTFPKNPVDGRCFIPGSTIKGELRSVLEILGFGKLEFFNDLKYSQREFSNNRLYPKNKFADVKGGWLSKNGDAYILKFHSKNNPGRIRHDQLTSDSNKSLKFLQKYQGRLNKDSEKSAVRKYEFYQKTGESLSGYFEKYGTENYKEVYKRTEKGISGTIVLTGQPSGYNYDKGNKEKRNKDNGKFYEFVFWDPDQEITFSKDDDVIKNFLFAYYDHDPREQSHDFKEAKNKLQNGQYIPVFITLEKNKVKHFGLSMLYKLPYGQSVGDIINKNKDHDAKGLDMVETIFGRIDDEGNNLKGRVHVGHAFSYGKVNVDSRVTMTLGSPKATFYPYYIKQKFRNDDNEIDKDYLTYNDGEIAGRKRYPIVDYSTDSFYDRNIIFKKGSAIKKETDTQIKPLSAGTVFKSTVNFHNVMPEELGALLSAITFHGHKNCRHNVGMAKPLGFGVTHFGITDLRIQSNQERKKVADEPIYYMASFERALDTFSKEKFQQAWKDTEQVTELLNLATPINTHKNILAYLELSIGNNQNNNEFEALKRLKMALPRYSRFIDREIQPLSLIDPKRDDYDNTLKSRTVIDQKEERLDKIRQLISKAEEKIKSLKIEQERETGLSERLNGISDYGIMQNVIMTYKIYQDINEQEPLPEDDRPIIIKKLDEYYSQLNGKKKNLFLDKSSRKGTISSWIGQEEMEKWFDSKKQ